MTAIDALSAMRRANQVFHEQLSERFMLNCGIAFLSDRHGQLPGINQVREMVIPPGGSMGLVFQEVEAFFCAKGLVCSRWVPAAAQPPEPVEAVLAHRGFASHQKTVWVLGARADTAPGPSVRILPARAMRGAVREIVMHDEYYPLAVRELAAGAALDRLDDPRYEMLVAMRGDRPAGLGALLEAGEIGAIYSLVVLEPFRGQGIARTLMKHLLALSRRLALRTTVLEVDGANPAAEALYRRCGFEPVGHYVEFVADRAPE